LEGTGGRVARRSESASIESAPKNTSAKVGETHDEIETSPPGGSSGEVAMRRSDGTKRAQRQGLKFEIVAGNNVPAQPGHAAGTPIAPLLQGVPAGHVAVAIWRAAWRPMPLRRSFS
jgi:hypothetical protein